MPDDLGQRGGAGGVQAPTIPDDLIDMLDLLAQTIVDAMAFGVAAVNLVRPDGRLEVVSVAGDPEAQAALKGNIDEPEVWDELLSLSEQWGRLRFLDHRTLPAGSDALNWVPDVEPVDAPDAWHPEDALFAPLTAQDGSRLGILSVDLPHDGRRPDAATCRALEAFAISAALAIEHSKLRARAEESEGRYRNLAMHDHLTGLANRPAFFERLTEVTATGSDRPMAVLFVDLDRFKSINDRYTHVAGDHLLEVVARRIQHCVRDTDAVVRWGGDEFLVVLDAPADEAAAREVGERIGEAIAQPVQYDDHVLHVTASVGVAYCSALESVTPDELVRQADAAMYAAKRRRARAETA